MVLAFLLALLLIAVTLDLFVSRWMGNGGPLALGPLSSVPNAQSSPTFGCGHGGGQVAEVGLAIVGFSPQSSTVTLDVGMCIPPNMLVRIHATGGKQERATGGDLYSQNARARYAHVPVGVEYAVLVPPARGKLRDILDITRETDFGRAVRGSLPGSGNATPGLAGSFIPLGRLVLPMDSAPERYPFDWYATFGYITLNLGGLGLSPITYRFRRSPSSSSQLPFSLTILQEKSTAPFTVQANAGATGGPHETGAAEIELRIVRGEATRRYVVIVALIPLLLTSLLGVSLIGRRASRGRMGSDVLIGVAALILALLPIRLVLVPADISVLTLVDYWLGFVIGLLAAVAFLAIAWHSEPTSRLIDALRFKLRSAHRDETHRQ